MTPKEKELYDIAQEIRAMYQEFRLTLKQLTKLMAERLDRNEKSLYFVLSRITGI